jgi:endoglucanase
LASVAKNFEEKVQGAVNMTNLNDTTSLTSLAAFDFAQLEGNLLGKIDGSELTRNAVRLNGGSDVLAIEDSLDINLGTHSQRTIAALWFKADDIAANHKQVLYKEGGATRGLNIYLDGGKLYVGGWNKPTTESNWQGTWLNTQPLKSGEWYHVALVLNGGTTLQNNALIGYLNGEEFGRGTGSQLWEHGDDIGIGNIRGTTTFAASSQTSSTLPASSQTSTTLAASSQTSTTLDPATVTSGFVGAINQFALYNQALAADTIQTLANISPPPVTVFEFNNAAGTTAVDRAVVGLQTDKATLKGGATWSQDGVKGTAVQLKGGSSVVALDDSQDINLGVHGQRTIAFWFKADNVAVADRKQILYEEGGATRGLNIYLEGGKLYIGGWNKPTTESNWQGTWLSTSAITSNQWHHVALVLHGNTKVQANALLGYLDGTEFGRGSGSQVWEHADDVGLGNIAGSTLFYQAGQAGGQESQGTDGYGFVGLIDQFSLYDRALSAKEVENSVAQDQAPATLFDFDHLSGKTAFDQAQIGLQADQATLLGNAHWSNDGMHGLGVRFEGGNSAVQITDSADINLGIHSQRTISLWFKADNAALLGRKQVLYEEGGATRGLNIYLDQGRLYAGGWNAIAQETNWQGTWLSTRAVTSGEWHHVALVLDGGPTLQQNVLTAYLDGQQFGQGAGSQLWEHGADIGLGNVKDGTAFAIPGQKGFEAVRGDGDYGFLGTIDDVSVYNYALSGSAIHTLATAPSADLSRKLEVFAVSPTIIGLRFEVNDIQAGGQVPYVAQTGDRIDSDGWLTRNGVQIGRVVGAKKDTLYLFDRITSYDLNTQWADQLSSYRIVSQTDQNYLAGTTPGAVFRKSKIIDTARTGSWNFGFEKAHSLFLQLDKPLTTGDVYTINFQNGALTFPDATLTNLNFVYDPFNTRSEAVHVSQIGFDPDDKVKVAFLSTWMGTGSGNPSVSYQVGQKFSLIDEATNKVVYTGQLKLAQGKNSPSNFNLNYNGTDVYRMDFGDFKTAGTYRVYVEGVGCSFDFKIGEQVWDDAFYTAVRGLYHQRSGIALGQPYTDWQRPRSLHPSDGLVVYQSTTMLVNTSEGLFGGENFATALTRGSTGQVVQNAWGGWHDAGDWDRRIQHTSAVRQLLELVELSPNYLGKKNLNLPESNNNLPDLVDEALWGLDVFRRLQRADGAISGGIEGGAGPDFGEGSWKEANTWYVYAPDAWSSYQYASAAAKAAYVLQSYNSNLANVYRDSAIRAMQWAEANPLSNTILNAATNEQKSALKDSRNLAAAELYRLTGSSQWSQIFLATTNYTRDLSSLAYNEHQLDAAFVYLRTQRPGLDTNLLQKMTQNFKNQADFLLSQNDRFGFGELLDPWTPVGWGTSGATLNQGQTVARAHYLTGNEQYRNLLIKATQFGLGANPDNLVYTTGLGERNPNSALIEDMAALGATPPPGIGVYGPYNIQQYGWFWGFDLHPNDVTNQSLLPVNESYQDFFYDIPMTEFTIQQTTVPNAYVWGYLAASDPNPVQSISAPYQVVATGASITRGDPLLSPTASNTTSTRSGDIHLTNLFSTGLVSDGIHATTSSDPLASSLAVSLGESTSLTGSANDNSLNSNVSVGGGTIDPLTGLAGS